MNKFFDNILSNKRLYLLLFLFMVCFGILIRSYTLFNNTIGSDSLQHYIDTEKNWENKRFPVTGVQLYGSSARIPGGGYYLLLSLPVILGKSPLAIPVFSTLLMILTAGLFVWSVRKYCGTAVALMIAALLIANPNMLNFESGIWNPYDSAILSFLLAALVFEILAGNDHPAFLFFLLPVTALMSQCHLTAIFYIPVALSLYMIFFYKGKNAAFFWLGIIGAALLYVPYLMSELSNGFSNTREMLSVSKNISGILIPRLTFLLVFPSIELNPVFSGNMASSMKFLLGLPWYIVAFALPVVIISLILSIAAFIYGVKRLIDNIFKKNDPLYSELDKNIITFFFVMIGSLIVCFMLFKIPPWMPHYYYPVFAFCFFPLIVFFRDFSLRKIQYRKILLALSLIIMLAGGIVSYFNFKDCYSHISIQRQMGYTKALLDDSAGKPFAFEPGYLNGFYGDIALELLKRPWKSDNNSKIKYVIFDPADENMNPRSKDNGILIYGNSKRGLYRLQK